MLKPVEWSFEVKPIEEGVYEFIATAQIDDKWAIYSQHTGEGGPFPLEFTYDNNVSLIGNTLEESIPIKKMSELFEIEVIKFEKKAVFTQKFKPTGDNKSFSGTLQFMCCDNLRCLPPTDVEFDVAF